MKICIHIRQILGACVTPTLSWGHGRKIATSATQGVTVATKFSLSTFLFH